MVNGYLGDEMGRLYVKKHFPDSSRIRVEKTVETIIRGEAVDEAEWMTPEARRAARDKLGRLSASVGHPSRWRDYSRLRDRRDHRARDQPCVRSARTPLRRVRTGDRLVDAAR